MLLSLVLLTGSSWPVRGTADTRRIIAAGLFAVKTSNGQAGLGWCCLVGEGVAAPPLTLPLRGWEPKARFSLIWHLKPGT